MSNVIPFSKMSPDLEDHHIKKYPSMSFTVDDFKQIKDLVEAEPVSPKKMVALRELKNLADYLRIADNTMSLSETMDDFRDLMQ
jgi:hypothetical protein